MCCTLKRKVKHQIDLRKVKIHTKTEMIKISKKNRKEQAELFFPIRRT